MSFARGTHSISICDRCGFKYDYTDLIFEATGLFVCPECDDGIYDKVRHPQNYPARLTERIALKNARPDVDVSTTSTWTPSDSSPRTK